MQNNNRGSKKGIKIFGKSVSTRMLVTLLFLTQYANAGSINYDIVFYETDFSEISAYSGGFTYDDNNQFISNFKLDMNMFGGLDLGLSVPAAALHLGTPPGTAVTSQILASLVGGDAGLCANGCNAVFSESNVFAVLDNFYNTVDPQQSSLSTFGYYQVLPSEVPTSEVPEPATMLLMLFSGLALFGKDYYRRQNRT
jgi:hypothetical protein